MASNLLEKDITASIAMQPYYVEVQWRNGTLVMDEPLTQGGADLGPDPYSTLLASLAGCTLSTLRMYIDRKGWDIPEIHVRLNMQQLADPLRTIIEREITFPVGVDNETKERLLLIAKKCPVSKILENQIVLDTRI